ncbi:hypothetical protein ACNI65_17410 [Roseateles sp. So40a]|uniref:hypothetical protein n=1 Tax=Roseateles sp. So40a TaxID=3400226 RepID=UPI003A875E4E
MVTSLSTARRVDAIPDAAPASGGTRFARAMEEVGRIDPGSLINARHRQGSAWVPNLARNEKQVDRMQRDVQRSGRIDGLVKIAMRVQEDAARTTLFARTLSKATSTIKEIASAA